MNSKVLNYLSEKKDSFMDWFEANKTNIKTNATKVIATGLTLAALTNMAGCNGNPFENQNVINNENVAIGTLPTQDPTISTEPSLLPELKTREEIERDGITAQDVIDLYTFLAATCLTCSYPELTAYSSQFVEMSSPHFSTSSAIQSQQQPLPFFPLYETYTLPHLQYSNPNISTLSNVYEIGVSINLSDPSSLSCEQQNLSINLAFDQENFEKLANLFNLTPFIIDQQHIDNLTQEGHNLNKYLGLTAIPQFSIDTNYLSSATQDQLWIIYNTLENATKLNLPFLNSNLPVISPNWEIEP